MNVSAVIVTRGDQSLEPSIGPMPKEWDLLIWNNGAGRVSVNYPDGFFKDVPDMSVYGRYAAIEHTDAELIYVQDDDCVVSDPQAIVDAWIDAVNYDGVDDRVVDPRYLVVCNMPPEFRHDFYEDHALVGFGACFHRDAPEEAFASFWTAVTLGGIRPVGTDFFERTCDIVFTGLTPRVLVDVPRTDLPWQAADNRMWKQPTHMEERKRMLDLVKQVRDDR